MQIYENWGLMSIRCKEFLQTETTMVNSQMENWARKKKRQFIEKEMQIVLNLMKIWSIRSLSEKSKLKVFFDYASQL